MKTAWKQDRTEKFLILHRDKFACRYCGAMPGSESLEVDHLIPRSRGGSDHDLNRATACKTCNRRKSNTIVFPHDLIERMDSEDGWYVHKTFGEWSIVFCDDAVGVEKEHYGFIDGKRLFDDQLMMHLYSKPWGHVVFRDMEMAFAHLRCMLLAPNCR